MQVELNLRGQPVESVFDLLGRKENDITFSVGWALARSPAFCSAFLAAVAPGLRPPNPISISLQEHGSDRGFTDIEIKGQGLHVIVEAKRGWLLPHDLQLTKYAGRVDRTCPGLAKLVTMSECTSDYAALHLPKAVDGMSVCHLGWRDIDRLARIPKGTHAEKRLLSELRTYLSRIAKMQDQTSNLVYVVALGAGAPEWSTLSWIEIVRDRRRYFHPVGGAGWPKEPPNYLGVRYNGHLQSVHHIDSWEIVTNLHAEMPEISLNKLEPHFIYALGPPIVPAHAVKSTGIYPNGRVWAMLDLLLTSKTIAEARDKTKQRMAEA